MRFVLLSTLIVIVTCQPIKDDEYTLPPTTTDSIPPEIQRDINLVMYIENFKNAMTEYVTSEYKNLTIQETEEVKLIIEQFLINFATDLKDAVENQFNNATAVDYEDDDGTNDDAFDHIGEKVRTEFPEVNEDTANRIVHRLRRNLIETRKRLDLVIRRSAEAQHELNSNGE